MWILRTDRVLQEEVEGLDQIMEDQEGATAAAAAHAEALHRWRQQRIGLMLVLRDHE